MTLPIPPPNGTLTKYEFVLKAVRDLGFPIVICGFLLYSVMFQIPRNELAINNARAALVDMNGKLDHCLSAPR